VQNLWVAAGKNSAEAACVRHSLPAVQSGMAEEAQKLKHNGLGNSKNSGMGE